ncbi:TlpA family protein disulfide reductase [Oceanobacillus halophilus]|uniref:TlpA family protein disulfide reductase n=1 Tax=Oceanobacillus halophilus TaxID=930130 RepID=A0A494ZW52_9BACI|nr:redoxin domain-containing protein [Oceanobacillus halophilus]RKQ30801.1 TlpA family protein disulfide reductase [Oceanobacillus halophilus]
MKKMVLLIIVVGMLGWALYDFVLSDNDNPSSNDVEVGIEQGQVAPDFELTTLNGETAKLSDFRGKRVFINFWATWCPPCRAEMPDMQELYENKDVEILAVNLTASEKSEEGVVEFVEDYGLTFPILMDVEGQVESLFQVSAYPTSYLVDSEGRIQYKAIGAMNYDLMVQEVDKLK